MAKKNTDLMKEAKDVMKVGATTMVGHGVLAGLSNVPGMPAQAGQTAKIAGSGLTLVNVGQLAKSGMTVVKMFDTGKSKKLKKSWW